MYNSDTEVMFPVRAIPGLKGLRGPKWDELIDYVLNDANDEEKLAFVLTIVRLVGCSGCNADSFRAMRGCTKCAQQSIRRFRGDDVDLLKLYEKSKIDIENHNKGTIS
ncbi:MAG: hypothetical protein RBT01_01070 [Anaerolineaceae bacterium]|jgi:hypothetical protein|nr:hypothetical protein [Anaerolineaceae bacterium]